MFCNNTQTDYCFVQRMSVIIAFINAYIWSYILFFKTRSLTFCDTSQIDLLHLIIYYTEGVELSLVLSLMQLKILHASYFFVLFASDINQLSTCKNGKGSIIIVILTAVNSEKISAMTQLFSVYEVTLLNLF